MIAAALLLAAAQAGPPVEPPPIVVTAERPDAALAALAACRADRACPPEKRIELGVRAGEILFINGDYRRAQRVLVDAGDAPPAVVRSAPLLVAGARRAAMRASLHLGDVEAARRAAFGIGEALRLGLPPGDWRVAYANLEAADFRFRVGQADLARRAYADLLDAPSPVGPLAALRLATLEAVARRQNRTRLRAIAADPDPRMAPFALAAQVMLARLSPPAEREAAVEAVIAAAKAAPGPRAMLLFAPAVDLGRAPLSIGGPDDRVVPEALLTQGPNASNQWIDVSFRVTADGAVHDPAVLRARGSDWWHRAVLRALAGRRYAPAAAADPDGALRLERFTLTASRQAVVGSRVARPVGALRVESLDLTTAAGG